MYKSGPRYWEKLPISNIPQRGIQFSNMWITIKKLHSVENSVS